jgi:t-SNARE complex subunit (syntaxin)
MRKKKFGCFMVVMVAEAVVVVVGVIWPELSSFQVNMV